MRVCVCARVYNTLFYPTRRRGKSALLPFLEVQMELAASHAYLALGPKLSGSGFCRGKTLPKPPTTLNGDSGCWALNNALKDESMEA